jgi:deoxyribonuclease V
MPALSLHHDHSWDLTPKEAVAVQRRLAPLVDTSPLPGGLENVRTVAGLDVSVRGDRVRAAVVVLALPHLGVVGQAIHEDDVAFPYVPGLLSFREVPAVLPALEKLKALPDVLMLDAQGRAHPRRFGLACHLGLLLDLPSLGVAKTRLVGRHEEPLDVKGAAVPLEHKGDEIGLVMRTRERVKPVFVSVGHRMTLDEAAVLTLACTTRYKLPEPTRLAHKLSKDGAI